MHTQYFPNNSVIEVWSESGEKPFSEVEVVDWRSNFPGSQYKVRFLDTGDIHWIFDCEIRNLPVSNRLTSLAFFDGEDMIDFA